MAVLLALSCGAYMVLGARGNWSFVLSFRSAKLAALLLVGVAVATSTVLFQTITRNRILTPSIMGFDALYILILTAAVFFLGAQSVVRLAEEGIFAVNVSVLMAASLLLFGALLRQARNDLMRLVLTGIIFGTFFRALSSFMMRMIDPNEFAVIQVASFARFARIETELLLVAAALTGLVLAQTWRIRHRLDVLALGHEASVNLGESPRRGEIQALILVSALVSVSTALVGPVAFLGLLVVSIAHMVTPTPYHRVLLPSAALISCIVLVAGQTVLERVLGLTTPLSVVVDFLGGFLFLALLLRRMSR